MTTSKQTYYKKLGLALKDVFVLTHLKKLRSPVTLDSFLELNPLTGLNNKNLRNTINKLEKLNLLVKIRMQYVLGFIFPFLSSVKHNRKKPFRRVKIKPFKTYLTSIKQPLFFTKYNYYNNIINNKHNVLNINTKKNIKNNIISEDDNMSIEFIKKKISKLYGFPIIEKKQNIVVSKNNYNYLKELKEKFKKEFPDKSDYINCKIPENFDFDLLVKKVKESPFLSSKDNLGFTWLLSKYDAIINNCYAPYKEKTEAQGYITKIENKPDFSQRTYENLDFSSLYDTLDDIKV